MSETRNSTHALACVPTRSALVEEVQRRPALEPLDLRRAVRVVQRERLRRAVRMAHDARDRLAGSEIREPRQADAVVLADLVVVRGVGERERQQALLLQVALVDAREGPGDHGRSAQKARRQGRMLAATAL